MSNQILSQFVFTTLSEVRSGLSFGQITFLTFEAVVQVFIICVSGFWATQAGLLNNEGVKTISRLNVDLFTPALIFSKLASSLSLKKLLEVIIIPILYGITTLVSYGASIIVSKWLNLTEPESNFVTAMSVFGNSNSLPVSITLALAYSLPNLEWDDLPNDSPDQIASRGLIYLLIFQQLGQMLRWSWGYNKLLAKQPHHVIFYDSSNGEDTENLLPLITGEDEIEGIVTTVSDVPNINEVSTQNSKDKKNLNHSSNETISNSNSTSSLSSSYTPNNSDFLNSSEDDDLSTTLLNSQSASSSAVTDSEFFIIRYSKVLASYMNPPLWSMLFAMIVASVPFLKGEFYENDGFIQHTLSSAIKQIGGVSIPLILVVLGANLAPSSDIPPACPHYKRMIIGSLLGRMVLPSLVLLPMIVLSVKYIGLSIMDDPIFLITSFLLITSPPAIQLSQICQLNELYQKEMAGVLFYGYAVLTLPVTIIVVVVCIEALKWANA